MFTELHLSEAINWDMRSTLPNSAGVYVISNGDTVYVGRTWGVGGLKERIRAFHRSATTGAKGHAGGVTFHEKFGPEVSGLKVKGSRSRRDQSRRKNHAPVHRICRTPFDLGICRKDGRFTAVQQRVNAEEATGFEKPKISIRQNGCVTHEEICPSNL